MAARRRFRKRAGQAVSAVQLALDTEGFAYRKWGAEQRCKRGDWLVDNGGEVYTVDAAVFARTYRPVGPGRWVKVTPVWAEPATCAGSLPTHEGRSHYEAGDWLVANQPDGGDAYCIERATFEALYEPDDEPAAPPAPPGDPAGPPG
ncbi:MAG: hypothetical protein L6Q75_01725 [Burkholderiaceae bacterium]|nr:hypothetical protein [Burkholderiaceae bacterium]